jgi:hypothetical protein
MAYLDTATDAQPSGLTTNREELVLDAMLHTATTAPYKGSLPTIASSNDQPRVFMDDLAAVSAAGHIEGNDTDGGGDQYTNVGDYRGQSQRWVQTGSVTDEQGSKDSAVGADLEGTKQKLLKQCMRNIEHTLVSDQDKIANVPNTTAGITEGLGSFTDPTNTNFAADYRCKTDSVFTGALSTLDDAALDALIASIYKEGGEYENLTLLAWPKLRSAIVFNTTRNAGTGSRIDYNVTGVGTIPYNVELMDTAYGKMNMINSNPQTGTEGFGLGYIYDPKYLHLHVQWGERASTYENRGGGTPVAVDYFAAHTCQGANRLGKIIPVSA